MTQPNRLKRLRGSAQEDEGGNDDATQQTEEVSAQEDEGGNDDATQQTEEVKRCCTRG